MRPKLAVEMLKKVRIPDPERRAEAYPFELSGGMCQRIMIAIALACRPALLIADEPTTGLDVTTQAVIMDLIGELAHASGMATIFITHDLALAAEYCDRIVVMHAGHIVEAAPSRALFSNPRHPYSAKLWRRRRARRRRSPSSPRSPATCRTCGARTCRPAATAAAANA
jgi:peptide/nickel transport system ATP-binding protein